MRRVVGLWLVCLLMMSSVVTAQTGVETCDTSADINVFITDGQNALLGSDYDAALEDFTCAVQTDPDNPAGYTGRAEAYTGLERYVEARSDLLSVLAINRDLQIPPPAEATPDPDQPAPSVIDEAPIVAQIEAIEAQIMPVELDVFVTSATDQFGLSFPGDQLSEFAQAGSLENIILLNDTGIYRQAELLLDNRDVLMIFEMGSPQTIAGVPLDSSLLDVAQALRNIDAGDSTPITRISTMAYSGYTYTGVTTGSNPQATLIFDLDPSNNGMLILKVTLTTANQDDFVTNLPLLLTIVDSLQVYAPLAGGSDDAAGLFVNEGDGFTLALPDGWAAESIEVDGRDALAITSGGAYTPDAAPVAGSPYAIVSYGSASELLNSESLDLENAPVQIIEALTGATQGARALPYEGFNAGLVFTSDGTTDRFIFSVMLDNDFYVVADMSTATGSDADFFEAVMALILSAGFSN